MNQQGDDERHRDPFPVVGLAIIIFGLEVFCIALWLACCHHQASY